MISSSLEKVVGLFVVAFVILRIKPEGLAGRLRAPLFALLNVFGVYYLFFRKADQGSLVFAVYVGLLLLHWGIVWAYLRSESRRRWLYWLILLSPVAILIFVKIDGIIALVGFSYMAFRLSYLAVELDRDPSIRVPLSHYIGFAFFVPTIAIGPISPFSSFIRTSEQVRVSFHNLANGFGRVFVGSVKFCFLANVIAPLTFDELWRDGFEHSTLDFFVSGFASYAYLYFNFSGYCDIVVGASAMLGIQLAENFDLPYTARNIQEFWKRWHMSLANYFRDVFFSPLTLKLARWIPPQLAVAFLLPATFLLIGIWHGFHWGYALFGLWHGAGMLVVHFYGLWIRSKPQDFRQWYLSSKWIRAMSTCATLVHVSLSFFFFENVSLQQMQETLAVLSW